MVMNDGIYSKITPKLHCIWTVELPKRYGLELPDNEEASTITTTKAECDLGKEYGSVGHSENQPSEILQKVESSTHLETETPDPKPCSSRSGSFMNCVLENETGTDKDSAQDSKKLSIVQRTLSVSSIHVSCDIILESPSENKDLLSPEFKLSANLLPQTIEETEGKHVNDKTIEANDKAHTESPETVYPQRCYDHEEDTSKSQQTHELVVSILDTETIDERMVISTNLLSGKIGSQADDEEDSILEFVRYLETMNESSQ